MRRLVTSAILGLLATFPLLPGFCLAQDTENDEKPLGWTNATELGVVITAGNADTESIGFVDTIHRYAEKWRIKVRLQANRSTTDDDPFLLVVPGITWEPGEPPPPAQTMVVNPGEEPDVEKYFAEFRFDRDITKKFSWNTGGSWDRNRDAGIINRTIIFGGFGNPWVWLKEHHFSTSYGLSYTWRDEEDPDPEKEDQFLGVRLNAEYLQKFGRNTTVENHTTFNMSLRDSSDYSADMTSSVDVSMNHHLSLKMSLQWLFNNEPALQDVDIIARVILVDPDGIPGNGDEFFETVSEGGIEITVGEDRARRESLDTIFRTTLVISF